jgi:GntR family transcriptional regulator
VADAWHELTAKRDRRPLPAIIRGLIEDLIRRGELRPGSQLPSEGELAEMLSVSRPTLREALGTLEAEGFVVRRRGIGTFVGADALLRKNLNANFGVTDLIESLGSAPAAQAISIEDIEADETEAEVLGVPVGSPLVRVQRVRTSDELPVVFSIDVLPRDLVANVARLGEGSIYRVLESVGHPVHHGVARIRPVNADRDLARWLRLEEGAPLLLLDQIDYEATERALLHSLEWHVADAFEVTVYRKGPSDL